MSWQALNWCAGLHQVRGPRRAVLWALANRHNATTGLATMGMTTIANEAGLSRSAAHRIVRTLEAQGLVQVPIRGAGTRPAAYCFPGLASHPKRDAEQISTGPTTELSTGPASVPPKRDAEVAADSRLPAMENDLASHSEKLASHSGGMPYRNARAPKGNQDQDLNPTVVTQDPAAATAPPDGVAAAKQPGSDASVVPRTPDGRRDWKLILNPDFGDEPSPNGRDPPHGRRAELR